jgi:hypothetical protein
VVGVAGVVGVVGVAGEVCVASPASVETPAVGCAALPLERAGVLASATPAGVIAASANARAMIVLAVIASPWGPRRFTMPRSLATSAIAQRSLIWGLGHEASVAREAGSQPDWARHFTAL